MTDHPPVPGDGRILFFSRDRDDFGFLSNFHPAPLVLDGAVWPTAEHFYQGHKSFAPAYRTAILAAPSAGMAKRLGTSPVHPLRRSKGSWFILNQRHIRRDWDEVKVDVMRRAAVAKFTQHETLAAQLWATHPAELIEDNPRDEFWGAGPTGTGANTLGKLLVEVRGTLG